MKKFNRLGKTTVYVSFKSLTYIHDSLQLAYKYYEVYMHTLKNCIHDLIAKHTKIDKPIEKFVISLNAASGSTSLKAS